MNNNKIPGKVEISAPAGSYESLSAAIRAGADSVYFGAGKLNMRSRSSANFSLKDISKIAEKCRRTNVKSVLVLNTLVYDKELGQMRDICKTVRDSGVSALVVSDIAAMEYARSLDIPVHISVQANISNIEAVRFYAKYADAMILARELTLEQIRQITDTIKKENICGPSGKPVAIEIFAHGALCVSVSGKCYMSLAAYNTSANRGACYQNCRRKYKVTDEETGDELIIDNQYVMSPKDICTIRFLDKIIGAGVSILKLEGRGRSADYVSTVTKVYREAADACLDGSFSRKKALLWEKELESVFNRGFWQGGYYLGKKLGEWAASGGNKSKLKKTHAGHVSNYFSKIKVAELNLKATGLEKGQKILISGNTTGALQFEVQEIRLNGESAGSAPKGSIVSIPVPEKVRRNDMLYLLEEVK